MKKVALLFGLAVFVPSLVLACLAVRSLRDQQFVLERQRSLLYQGVADSLSDKANALLAEQQREFGRQVEAFLADSKPLDVAASFDQRLCHGWTLAEIGFVVSLDGQVYCPDLFERAEARRFRLENDKFLCSRETVAVYWNSPKGAINLSQLDQKETAPAGQQVYESKLSKEQKQVRNVEPQQKQQAEFDNTSKVAPAEAEFRQLIGDSTEGTVARFLQNKLNLMFWYRSSRDPQLVFGALINLARLVEQFQPSIFKTRESLDDEICVTLLDDAARPRAQSHARFETNWKRPFVAAEIGEALPHWEIGVYLLNPFKFSQSASLLKLTLGLLIAVLVLAIALGGWLIVMDLRRQLALARQKTDFVSNV